MSTTLHFTIKEIIPYINWVYFYHAWGVKEEQGKDIRHEAETLLHKWETEQKHTLFRTRLFQAHSSGEDILLYDDKTNNVAYTIPLLRQQQAPFLCLADFLPPTSLSTETMGVFASMVPFGVEGLLEQTLADRLAEATAERGHEVVRTKLWGYSPNENLTPKQMFAEQYQGKRPAVGYPSLPDQSLNFILTKILDFPSMGITLTENGAMIPHACTTGLMIAHPKCRHFKIGHIGIDQLQDYAKRRKISIQEISKFIDTSI